MYRRCCFDELGPVRLRVKRVAWLRDVVSVRRVSCVLRMVKLGRARDVKYELGWGAFWRIALGRKSHFGSMLGRNDIVWVSLPFGVIGMLEVPVGYGVGRYRRFLFL